MIFFQSTSYFTFAVISEKKLLVSTCFGDRCGDFSDVGYVIDREDTFGSLTTRIIRIVFKETVGLGKVVISYTPVRFRIDMLHLDTCSLDLCNRQMNTKTNKDLFITYTKKAI